MAIKAREDRETEAFARALGARMNRCAFFPLRPIPCTCDRGGDCPSTGKHPAMRWSTLEPGENAVPAEWPHGIGIATGHRSGGIVVIDVDIKDGAKGPASLRALEHDLGSLPRTLRVESPTGGYHLYFYSDREVPSVTGWAGGIDVRGEGGMVVIPGSPHRAGGVYRVTDTVGPARLPDPWAAKLEERQKDRLDKATPETVGGRDPGALREEMTQAVKGKRGGAFTALRRALKGERFVRAKGGNGPAVPPEFGGVDDLIVGMFCRLAALEDFRTVPWADVRPVLDGAFSRLQEDDREHGNAVYSDADLAMKWEHARRWAEGAARKDQERREAADLFALRLEKSAEEAAVLAPVLISAQGNDYWILDGLGPHYQGPYGTGAAVLAARKIWLDSKVDRPTEIVTSKSVRLMQARELAETYATAMPIHTRRQSLSVSRAEHAAEGVIVEPIPREVPIPEARQDDRVDKWLRRLGGESLIGFVRMCSPQGLGVMCPGLILMGKANSGKTFLALGLARALGFRAPGGADAIEQNNRDALRRGIVLFDERIPPGHGGRPRSDEVKALITAPSHDLRGKYQTAATLDSFVRVMICGNAADALIGDGVRNADDREAFKRRFIVRQVGDGPWQQMLDAFADRPGDPGDPARMERLVGHLLWIQAQPGAAPAPDADALDSYLQIGGGVLGEILDAIAEMSEGNGLAGVLGDRIWFRVPDVARRVGKPSTVVGRVLRELDLRSARVRRNPLTCDEIGRCRWSSIDLEKARSAGWD